MYPLKLSTAGRPLVFRMVDETDGHTPETGLTCTVTIRKAGGSFASPTGAVTEIANGYYQVAGNATDTDTAGPLILHATATGAVLDGPHVFHVEALLPGDTVAANLIEWLGVEPEVLNLNNRVEASISFDSGNVDYGEGTQAVPANVTHWRGNVPANLADTDKVQTTATISGDVTVGGYATGQDPATLLLVTPANKLATDSSGRVLLQPTQTGVTIPTVTTVTGIGSSGRNDIADSVLSRAASNVEGSAGPITLCGLMLATFRSERDGSDWNVYRTDGSTAFTTHSLVTSAGAAPITAVSS